MEMNDYSYETGNENMPVSPMTVSETTKSALKSTAGWTKFMAILQITALAFWILMGLIMIFSGSMIGNSGMNIPYGAGTLRIMGFCYLLIGVVALIPAVFLLRFSAAANQALLLNDEVALENSMVNMKSYWKFMGIFTIVIIALALLMMIVMIMTGVAATGF